MRPSSRTGFPPDGRAVGEGCPEPGRPVAARSRRARGRRSTAARSPPRSLAFLLPRCRSPRRACYRTRHRAAAGALDVVRPRLGLPPDPGRVAPADELVVCFAPPALHDPAIRLPHGMRSFHPGRHHARTPCRNRSPGWARILSSTPTSARRSTARRRSTRSFGAGRRLGRRAGSSCDPRPQRRPDALRDRRPGVRVVTFAPQRAVVERCSVVVCHGGYGTVLTDRWGRSAGGRALRADQFVNAAALERVGIRNKPSRRESRSAAVEYAMRWCQCWTLVRHTDGRVAALRERVAGPSRAGRGGRRGARRLSTGEQ